MTSVEKYQYYKTVLAGQGYPHALLDMDLLDRNIQTNLDRAGKKPIRVATKSIRSPEILQYLLDADPRIKGIMCFHGKEALYLSAAGFEDILMGYPVVDKDVLKSIGLEIKKGRYICLMVDCPAHLNLIEEVAREVKAVYPVCVDIDLSLHMNFLHFGVWRSPITDRDKLYAFIQKLKDCPHVRVDGLMGYEAQVAGLGDEIKGYGLKNMVIRQLKARSVRLAQNRREEAVTLLRSQFPNLRFVNGGGTGSVESTCQENAVSEITVGSGFYAPHLFDNFWNFELEPALLYSIQIVRIPAEGIYTCQGGGYVASGMTEPIKAPKVCLPEGARLDKNEGAGEVQTPVRYNGPEPLKIGDPVYLRHAKAGELCEHFNEILLIRNGKIAGKAATYRGLGLVF
ncbi:MAG: amino acid deaminase/aldolase [Lewinella sp.]|nr:amino acid deaminase/aldolase [Lewinella sp.]